MDAKDPTTNHNHAPATTITHASNITMVSQGASNGEVTGIAHHPAGSLTTRH
jgi:hypothetical protein